MTRFARLDPVGYALPEELAARLFSPALVVHLDRVRANLRRVIALCSDDPERWRPHVKTTKIPDVWAELCRAGLRHFKCATLREARVLAGVLEEEGADGADVLVAHPLAGPALAELGRTAVEHGRLGFSVLCEEPGAVAEIPAPLAVFADLNTGMDRTGVELADSARVLAIARAAGPRFQGLHFYEGHRSEPDLALRRRLAFAGYRRLLEIAGELRAARLSPREIVTSGTPAFVHALAFEPFRDSGFVHRVSPGTVVFHDLRSEEENEGLELEPAALVFTRVVSRPAAGIVTCDAGSKSLAAEAGDPCAFVLGHPELLPLAPSEEHLPLRVLSGPAPPRGTELLLVPRHVCPTVNLAEEAILVEAGGAYRVARVSARAHELLARAERRP